jgi:hypothetical protein
MFRNSHIRPDNCPRRKSQKKWVQNINRKLTPEEEAGVVVHETKRLNKLKNQLEKSGVYLDCQVSNIAPEIHSILYMVACNVDFISFFMKWRVVIAPSSCFMPVCSVSFLF